VRMLHSLDHPNVLKFSLKLPRKVPMHDTAYDLVRKSIYCDLKPSNISTGRVWMHERRLKDIEKTDPGDLGATTYEGTPCYMAPELFQEEGSISMLLISGPLVCLVKSMLSEPAPPLPDNSSRSFQNLINCLLMKDPAERLQNSMPMIPLPPQPAADNMVGLPTTPYLSERNDDKPSRQLAYPRLVNTHKKDENSAKVLMVLKGVNVLRMSRIARKNLQREKDKENYRRPPTETDENEAEIMLDPQQMKNIQLKELMAMKNCINQVDMLTDECSIKPDTIFCMRKARPKDNIWCIAAGSEPSNIFEAFWHPTDLAVKPAVPVLPFEALPATDYIRLPREQMNAFNSQIIPEFEWVFSGFRETEYHQIPGLLSMNSDAANVITNGDSVWQHLEVLFYISTQSDQDSKESNAQESPMKDNKSGALWQLYALRTIDNICSQGTDWTSRFASQDVIGHLCYIYKATGKQENTRLIAISCLSTPSSIQLSHDIACTLLKGNPREQQISLNLLNSALGNSHIIPNMSRYILSLTEEKQLVPGLISLIEQGADILRGKTLLFVALLCKNSRRWLPQFFAMQSYYQLLTDWERKDGFIHQCILDTVSSDIQQVMGGKRHGPIIALTGRAHPKSTIHLFPVILHLLGSVSFNHRVVTSQVLLQLANLMKILETPFQARDDFQMTLLRVLEAATEEPSVILRNTKYSHDSSLTADEQCLADLKTISHKYFLPMYPSFAEDEDPIPMYAQKLLVMLMEHDCVKLQVVRRIGNLLEFVTAKDMDDFLEPTLELCRAFIIRGTGSNRSIVLTKEPALLVDSAFSMSVAVDQQSCIMDICDLGGSMGIFLEVVGNSDPQISDFASDCVVLMLKAAPREATMGLTNLLNWRSSGLVEAWRLPPAGCACYTA
ncbi:hypothetical protein ZWY2020_037203, partial [Hordeum vulgare]